MSFLPSPAPRSSATQTASVLASQFAAFHDDTHDTYLRFACLQLGSEQHEAAERAVESTYARLGVVWGQVRRQPSPFAVGWELLMFYIQRELATLGRPSALVESAAFAQFAQETARKAINSARDAFTTMESQLGLYFAIASLPEVQFQVVVVHFVLGYELDVTARLLGRSPQTIRSNIRHARENLTKFMKSPDQSQQQEHADD